MIDPRQRVSRQPDVVERTMLADLARGPIFRLVRMVRHGPLCPAAILWVQTGEEPGQPENRMDRSASIAGFISGEPIKPARLYSAGKAGSRRITAAEYARLIVEIAEARRAGRYDPRTTPWKKVEIARLTPPFAQRSRR